ncbi:MAG: hypothetical protein ACTSW1_16815 [Candidatus Hodarchaeales archaeon]
MSVEEILEKISGKPELARKLYEILRDRFATREEFNRLLEELQKSREEYRREFREMYRRSDQRFEAMQLQIDRRFDGVDKKFDNIDKRFDRVEKVIKDIQVSQDRMMVSLEEEAKEVIEYLLKKNHNIKVTLDELKIKDFEVDIYGATDDLCVVGEAAVRLGNSKLDQLLQNIKHLKINHPSYMKEKTVKILYGIKILPELIEKAEKEDIWIVTATKELTPFKMS